MDSACARIMQLRAAPGSQDGAAEVQASGGCPQRFGGSFPMIPLKLSLSNFICYRENVPTLDFTGVHVACLCGGNGHGKSALLDGNHLGTLGQGESQDPGRTDFLRGRRVPG